MLSQVSRTLRTVDIHLHDLPRVGMLNNMRVLRMQEFDKVLTADRFPRLEKVKVHVLPAYDFRRKRAYNWLQIVVGTQKALPSLQTRGILEVVEGW